MEILSYLIIFVLGTFFGVTIAPTQNIVIKQLPENFSFDYKLPTYTSKSKKAPKLLGKKK